MKIHRSSLEPLEPRIAPASLNAAGTVLTYTDIDGDLVKITFTKARMDAGDFAFSTGTADDGEDTPRTLTNINLTGKTGAGFTLTATPKAGKGDSHANLTTISAGGTDLGVINVDGDVVSIMCGSGNAGAIGLKSFTALSMGRANPVGTAGSILNNAGSFTVKGDAVDVRLQFDGGAKSISIGGNLSALHGALSGVTVNGDVASLKIGGTIVGRGSDLPSVQVTGSAGAFTVGGSIIGGPDDLPSGRYQIELGTAKSITVGGDLRGGPGIGGGSLTVGGVVATVKIGGSMIGAQHVDRSGTFIGASVGSFTIGHDLVTDPAGSSTSQNGTIWLTGNLGSLKIGGDILVGTATSTGNSAATLTVDGTIGSLSVGGSIHGVANHPLYIAAGGTGAAQGAPAIKSFTVKHSVELARIVTGYSGPGQTFTQHNTDAGIGSIVIGGNLTGTQIDVGSTKGTDNLPGTPDDGVIGTSLARIDSLKIGGALTGIAGDSTTYYVQAPVLKKATIGRAGYGPIHGHIDFNSIGKSALLALA